jgi:hypothetical protein
MHYSLPSERIDVAARSAPPRFRGFICLFIRWGGSKLLTVRAMNCPYRQHIGYDVLHRPFQFIDILNLTDIHSDIRLFAWHL